MDNGELQISVERARQICLANFSKLGDGNIFFLEEAGKKKRGFKVRVDLELNTHFCFPGGVNARAMITGEGYDKVNQYAGIEVFRPKTVVANDGTEKGNPYFERDSKTGAMLSVFMRGIGIGYSPVGNLVAVDQTVYLNLQTILVQAIQSKIKKHPFLGMFGSRDQKPESIVYYKDNGKWGDQKVIEENPTVIKASGAWHFVPLTGDMGYWCNISHPEILAAFDDFTQKQRFLERTAFTILKRLILSSHPAIAIKTPIITEKIDGKYNKVEKAKAHIFVYGFKAEAGNQEEKRKDLEEMANRAAEGQRMADMEIHQGGSVDGAAEPETEDASLVADPTEIPENFGEGFDEEEPPPTNPIKQSAPVAEEATNQKPPTNTTSSTPAPAEISWKEKFVAIFDNKENQKKVQSVLKDMGLNMAGLRGAPDGTKSLFVKKFEEAK